MPLFDFDSNVMRLRLKRLTNIVNGYGFGLNIQDRGTPPALQISSIENNCEAEKSGLIRNGDIILRINNHDVSQCTYDEAIQKLTSTPMNAYASFTVRAPFGYVTRLITTFEEDGQSKTIRITERANRQQQKQQQLANNDDHHQQQQNHITNNSHLTPQSITTTTTTEESKTTMTNQPRTRKG